MPAKRIFTSRAIHALLTATALVATANARAAAPTPADVFDLRQWKLQVPGPKEVKDLAGHSSKYFRLNEKKELCLRVDAAEKGSTPNSKYVRAELRHVANWDAGKAHSLSAELRVVSSSLKPDKLTVMQIHGITAAGGHAPPLLRVAVQKGDLVAIIKTTGDGEKEEVVMLKKKLGGGMAKVDVAVKDRQLSIAVDGEERVKRGLGFWKHQNYFKAGCYPQATEGVGEVVFTKLRAE